MFAHSLGCLGCMFSPFWVSQSGFCRDSIKTASGCRYAHDQAACLGCHGVFGVSAHPSRVSLVHMYGFLGMVNMLCVILSCALVLQHSLTLPLPAWLLYAPLLLFDCLLTMLQVVSCVQCIAICSRISLPIALSPRMEHSLHPHLFGPENQTLPRAPWPTLSTHNCLNRTGM